MIHNLKTLRKITTTTRGKSRKDIILAVSAWEIQAREEIQQLKPLKREDPVTFERLKNAILGI